MNDQQIENEDNYSYMLRHNDTIVGFYSKEQEAQDALGGYHLNNKIEIGDSLEVLKISQ